MYISELTVTNIRGFHGPREAARLRFTRPDGSHAGWTVLAGRNGSGKTTLLQAMAVALTGPAAARSLVPSLPGWLSTSQDNGQLSATITPDPEWDRFARRGRTPENQFGAELSWLRFKDTPGCIPTVTASEATNTSANRGPWAENSQGWFVAGYGPFRRLLGGSSDAQRLMSAPGPVARLASLFHEDASLAEGVRWLVDLHLRRLEERSGAGELMDFVLRLLNDGLLPDGFQVTDVNSDGMWVTRGQDTIVLSEMSDGYRTVTALVLDLVRHAFATFGAGMIGADASRPTVEAPGIVLIDEIDAHLHVSWQKNIGSWLKRHFPQMQFVVTSHSPYICQSADPGGLIRLPGVDEDVPPRVVSDELYQRVVYGSGDDALLTELFGIDSPYSEPAEEKRRRLVHLERRVLDGSASPEEIDEFGQLQATLTSSLTTRVQEISARIGEER